jgi:hypothetical protein
MGAVPELYNSTQSSRSPKASVIPFTLEQEYSLITICEKEEENRKIKSVVKIVGFIVLRLGTNPFSFKVV